MLVKQFDLNGNNFKFYCESERTRNGFNHKCTISMNDVDMKKSTVHYVNRTWESYPFRTVMQNTVYELYNDFLVAKKEEFKKTYNVKRFCKSLQYDFDQFCGRDSFFMNIKALYNNNNI